MIRALPVPMPVFNPSTNRWLVPDISDVAPKQPTPKAPTTLVFSGETFPKEDDWDYGRGCRSKCWKEQSVRRTQHYRKG